MKRVHARHALIVLALAVLGVAGGQAEAQAPSPGGGDLKVEIPYNAVAYDQLPLWTAIDEKIFQRYGIDAGDGGAMESPSLVASILSGETIFAIVGEDAVISADLNGGDIVILAASTEKMLLAIEATPAIRSVADLKGKRIGISQLGTTTDFIARYILKQAGLDPKQDVTLLPVGSLANRLAALSGGAADAVVLGPPITSEAEQLGFHPVASMVDYDLLYYTSSLVAKRSWVMAHPDATLNAVRGYTAGIAAVFNDKPAAIAALGKYTKTTDAAVLDRTYRAFLTVLLKVPLPKPAALQTGLDQSRLPSAKNADPNAFIDTSFVDRLSRDGFIDRLYQ